MLARDLRYASASELIRLFRAREVSPVEVLNVQIEHESENGAPINAFTERMHESARQHAEHAELLYREAGTDDRLPALLGVTVATKEKHQIRGLRIELGLLGNENTIAQYDHPVVERLREAGAVIHARTTTPELSCATVTHSLLWGTTRNPWNLQYSPGGSSGGAGAALAAGFTTLATASDIAGSTRIPACFTGTVGYKAPAGRIPGDGPLAADWYRGDGPMARTVADTALLTNALSGRHDLDAASIPKGAVVGGAVNGKQRLRVALSVGFGDYVVDPDVEKNTRRIAAVLSDAGHSVEEVDLPISYRDVHDIAFSHFGNILGPSMLDPVSQAGRVSPYTESFLAEASRWAAQRSLYSSIEGEYRIQRLLTGLFEEYDLLLCPTSAVAALEAEGNYIDGVSVGGSHVEHYWQGHMTLPFNIANRHPVLAVPSGVSRCGIPTGVQLVAAPFAEQTVFAAGLDVESGAPWHRRFPDLGTLPTAQTDRRGENQ